MARKEEIPLFERAQTEVARDPGSPFYAWLADQMIRDGQLEQALSILEEGVDTNPNYITGPLLLANIYITRNKLEKARDLYNRVLERDPDNIKALYGLARIAFELREYSTGIAYIFQVISIDPYNRKIIDELKRRRQEYNAFLENPAPVSEKRDELDEIEDLDPQDILEATDLDGLDLDEELPLIEDTALTEDFDLAGKSLSGMDKLRTIEQEIGLAPKPTPETPGDIQMELRKQDNLLDDPEATSIHERPAIDGLDRQRKVDSPEISGGKPREIPGLDLGALELDMPKVIHRKKKPGPSQPPHRPEEDVHVDSVDALKAALSSSFGQMGSSSQRPLPSQEERPLTEERPQPKISESLSEPEQKDPDLSDLYDLNDLKKLRASDGPDFTESAEPSLDDLISDINDPSSLITDIDDVFSEDTGAKPEPIFDLPEIEDSVSELTFEEGDTEADGELTPFGDIEDLPEISEAEDEISDILPQEMDIAIEKGEPTDDRDSFDDIGEISEDESLELSETVERLGGFTPPEEDEEIEGLVSRKEFQTDDVALEQIEGLDLSEGFAPPEDIEEEDIEGLKVHEEFEGEIKQMPEPDEPKIPDEGKSEEGDLTDLLEGFDDISELEDIFKDDDAVATLKDMELDQPAEALPAIQDTPEEQPEHDIDFEDIFSDSTDSPDVLEQGNDSKPEEPAGADRGTSNTGVEVELPEIEQDSSPMSEILNELGESSFSEEENLPQIKPFEGTKGIKSELSSLLRGVESKFEDDEIAPPDADMSPTQITKIDDMDSLARILGVDLTKKDIPAATPEQEKIHMKGSELFDMLKKQGYEEKLPETAPNEPIRKKQDFVLDLSSFEDSTLEELNIDGMEAAVTEDMDRIPQMADIPETPSKPRIDDSDAQAALEAERESEKVVSNMEELLSALDIDNLPDLSDMVSSERKGTDIIIGPEEEEGLGELLDGTDLDDITGEQQELEDLLKGGEWQKPEPEQPKSPKVKVTRGGDDEDPDEELVDLDGQRQLEEMLKKGDWSGELSPDIAEMPDDGFVPDFGLAEALGTEPAKEEKSQPTEQKLPGIDKPNIPNIPSAMPHDDDDDDDEAQVFKRLKDAISDRDKILDRPVPKKERPVLDLDETQSEELDETGAKAQKELEALLSSTDWNSTAEQPIEKHRFSPDAMDADAELRKILEQDVFKADEHVDSMPSQPPRPSPKIGQLRKPDKVEGEELSSQGISEQQELEKLLNSDMWRKEPKPTQESSEFSEKAGSKEAMDELRDLLKGDAFEDKSERPQKQETVDDTYKGEIVTETMAEIFAAQGQTEDAINVYRKLVKLAHPERAKRYKMRLSMLEKRMDE